MHLETAEITRNKNIVRLTKHDLAIDGVACFQGAQVKSRGIPVPTVPCLHGRHGNCTVGTGIARLALGIAQ